MEWRQPATVDDYVGLRAAEVQHHVAKAAQTALRERDGRIGWLEERAGLPSGRGTKLLRGHVHMSLRDLQAIEGVLGPILMRLRYGRAPIESDELRDRFRGDAARWAPAS